MTDSVRQAQLYVISDAENHTLNIDGDGGFTCLICGHFVIYTSETEWGEVSGRASSRTFMHGTEPFHFCPNCGRSILTLEEWVEKHPDDVGKTFREIRERYV